MNKHKIRLIQRQCALVLVTQKEKILEACNAKMNQPNIHGDAQHIRINPRRQVKKLVKRLFRDGTLSTTQRPA